MRYLFTTILLLAFLIPYQVNAQCEVDIINQPTWCCAYPLEARPIEGIPPFTYQWSTSKLGRFSDTACTGTTYYVTMTDSVGCTSVDSAYVPLDTGSYYFSTSDASCLNCRDGQIIFNNTTVSCPGGYTVVTNPPNPFGPGFLPGQYTVTVTDLCGCSITDTVIIGIDTTVGIQESKQPTSRQIGNTLLFDQLMEEVRIYDLQGRMVRSAAWVRRMELDGLIQGIYLIRGIGDNGKLQSNKFLITNAW